MKIKQRMKDLEDVLQQTSIEADGQLEAGKGNSFQQRKASTVKGLRYQSQTSQASLTQAVGPLSVQGFGSRSTANMQIAVEAWNSSIVANPNNPGTASNNGNSRPFTAMTDSNASRKNYLKKGAGLNNTTSSRNRYQSSQNNNGLQPERDIVAMSRHAIRSQDRKQIETMPLHLKHTIFSMQKTMEKGDRASSSPFKEGGQMNNIMGNNEFVNQAVNNAIMDFQMRAGTSESGSRKIPQPSTPGGTYKHHHNHPKALLRMKIVEFHGDKNKEGGTGRGSNENNQSSYALLSPSSTTFGAPEATTNRVAFESQALIPYQPSVKRIGQLKSPEAVVLSAYLPQTEREDDFGQGQLQYDMHDQDATGRGMRNNQRLTMGEVREGVHKRPQTSALVPYQQNNDKRAMTKQSSAISSSQQALVPLQSSQLQRAKPHLPSPVDYQRISRYSAVQRPFSVKQQRFNTAISLQNKKQSKQQTSASTKHLSITDDQENRQSLMNEVQPKTMPNKNTQPPSTSSAFFQTQMVPTSSEEHFVTEKSSRPSVAKPAGTSNSNENLTREQIFNYLHNKRDKQNPHKAPYGLIEREKELFEEIVAQQKERQRPFSSPQKQRTMNINSPKSSNENDNNNAQTVAGNANTVIRDVNYINIYMQPSSKQETPLKHMRTLSSENVDEFADHRSEAFYNQLNAIIRETPLQDILFEAREKEKQFSTFQYIPPRPKFNTDEDWATIMGEEIGFEEANLTRENEARMHTRLLNALLIEVLSGGKYRDEEWFGNVRQLLEGAGPNQQRNSLKEKLQQYIDGEDLAKVFKSKMYRTLRLSEKKLSPSKSVQGILQAFSGSQAFNWASAAEDPQILSKDTFNDFFKEISEKVNDKQRTEIEMENIFEEGYIIEDQVIENFIKKEGLGEIKLEGEENDIQAVREAKALEAFRNVHTRHMKIIREKAKEFKSKNAEKSAKVIEVMAQFVDQHLQSKRKVFGVPVPLKLHLDPINGKRSPGKGSPERSLMQPSTLAMALGKGFRSRVMGIATKQELSQRQMIYTCFLEMVRQISTKQKDQALLLLKIWHSYFDQFDFEVERLVQSIKVKQREFDQILQNMKGAFTEIMKQKEKTESHFFELTQRIEELQKDLNVSRLIQSRDAELRKEAQENFRRMKVMFPNCEEYLGKIKLKDFDYGRLGLDRMKLALQRLQKPMPQTKEIFLIEDLDRIMASIDGDTVHNLNLKLDALQLQKDKEKTDVDAKELIAYLQSLLVEKETWIRDYDMLENDKVDAFTQTDIKLQDVQAFLKGIIPQGQQLQQHHQHLSHTPGVIRADTRSRQVTLEKAESGDNAHTSTDSLSKIQRKAAAAQRISMAPPLPPNLLQLLVASQESHVGKVHKALTHNNNTNMSIASGGVDTILSRSEVKDKKKHNVFSSIMNDMTRGSAVKNPNHASSAAVLNKGTGSNNLPISNNPYSILDPTAYQQTDSSPLKGHSSVARLSKHQQASSPAIINFSAMKQGSGNMKGNAPKQAQQDEGGDLDSKRNQQGVSKGTLLKFMQTHMIDEDGMSKNMNQMKKETAQKQVKIRDFNKLDHIDSSEEDHEGSKDSLNTDRSFKLDDGEKRTKKKGKSIKIEEGSINGMPLSSQTSEQKQPMSNFVKFSKVSETLHHEMQPQLSLIYEQEEVKKGEGVEKKKKGFHTMKKMSEAPIADVSDLDVKKFQSEGKIGGGVSSSNGSINGISPIGKHNRRKLGGGGADSELREIQEIVSGSGGVSQIQNSLFSISETQKPGGRGESGFGNGDDSLNSEIPSGDADSVSLNQSNSLIDKGINDKKSDDMYSSDSGNKIQAKVDDQQIGAWSIVDTKHGFNPKQHIQENDKKEKKSQKLTVNLFR